MANPVAGYSTPVDDGKIPTTELGHAVGLGWSSGYPWDASEWSPEVAWPLNIQIYDKMRRQDAQIRSVLNAITMPIRRTQWRIDPNGARDEVVAQIAFDLGLARVDDDSPAPQGRTRGRFNWGDYLRHAMLDLAYGHMPFEMIARIDDQGLARLARLAPRMPATLSKINIDRAGELVSIEQWPSGVPGDVGPNIVIPAERLVMHCHDREGGMWQGVSLLRAAYANWLIKGRLLRVDAMTKERNGMGVPIVEAPLGASPQMMAQLNQLAQSYRSGEASGGSIPAGAKLTLVGVTGTLPDVIASVKYHDAQMSQSVLAHFLEIVQTGRGSRALASSLIDFFILALQATADEFAETTNVDVVERLVDWNYGEDEPAPKVVCAEIGDDHQPTAEAIAALATAGALQPDESLDSWLRENYRMPARTDPFREPTAPPSKPTPPVAARRGEHPGKVWARRDRAPKWPGRKYSEALTAHYAPLVVAAFVGMLDPQTVAADFQAQIHAETVPADPTAQDLAHGQRFASGLQLDSSSLQSALEDMYREAYLTGAHAGDVAIEDAGGITTAAVATDIDWSKWVPGNPDAAAELSGDAGRGLVQLLGDAHVQIQGMTDTMVDELGRTLGDAASRGLSVDQTAKNIRELLADPSHAEMIATTETARGMSTATMDQYHANGIEKKQWLLSDGACPLCEENEADGAISLDDDFTNGDVPVHPWDVCAVGPVIDTGGD